MLAVIKKIYYLLPVSQYQQDDCPLLADDDGTNKMILLTQCAILDHLQHHSTGNPFAECPNVLSPSGFTCGIQTILIISMVGIDDDGCIMSKDDDLPQDRSSRQPCRRRPPCAER